MTTDTPKLVSDDFEALRAIDAANSELIARNQARAATMKAELGANHLLHPDYAPTKICVLMGPQHAR